VIVVTGPGDQENAIKAVGLGAYDFYEKPVDTETLQLIVDRAYQIHALERENVRLLRQDSTSPLDGIIAASEKMLEVCRMVEKVAPTNATTLLTGESGTGKELLARALHSLSTRVDKPLQWSADRAQFLNREPANQHLRREYRDGWKLP
jgi:two-component system NtrC family response regulator